MSDHVDRIRDQCTRQAGARADSAQAKDADAHARLVALVGAVPARRVVECEVRGLDVRDENGAVRFTHRTLLLVGRR